MKETWKQYEVVDAAGPKYNVRNYLEQRGVRQFMKLANQQHPIRRACDVGCGYGRLTMVLGEFAEFVTGFERELSFIKEAQELLPHISFMKVGALYQLPAAAHSFEFALSFTVFQHLTDSDAEKVLAELKRIVGGTILIVEETDPMLDAGDLEHGITLGRSVETYSDMMKPWQLIAQAKREVEPGYPRADVGSYMLYCNS